MCFLNEYEQDIQVSMFQKRGNSIERMNYNRKNHQTRARQLMEYVSQLSEIIAVTAGRQASSGARTDSQGNLAVWNAGSGSGSLGNKNLRIHM